MLGEITFLDKGPSHTAAAPGRESNRTVRKFHSILSLLENRKNIAFTFPQSFPGHFRFSLLHFITVNNCVENLGVYCYPVLSIWTYETGTKHINLFQWHKPLKLWKWIFPMQVLLPYLTCNPLNNAFLMFLTLQIVEVLK